MALQRLAGNTATASLLGRAPSLMRETGTAPAVPNLHQAATSAAAQVIAEADAARKQALVDELLRRGQNALAGIISALPPETPPFLLPYLLPARKGAFQLAFRLTPATARQALEYTDNPMLKGLILDHVLSTPEDGKERDDGGRFWLVYQNDGSGINPGFGSDQGPTALLKFMADYETDKGLAGVGFTVIDMHTPAPGRKVTPGGAPAPQGAQNRDLMYQVGATGPWLGKSAAHFRMRLFRGGGWTIDTIHTVGVDSAGVGEAIQDFIHTHISNSPHFPWPEGWRLLVENETVAAWRGGSWRWDCVDIDGHFEFEGAARGGTHREEAEAQARVVLTRYDVLGDTDILLHGGAVARAFRRHERGREQGVAGQEVGTSLGIGLEDLPGDFFVSINWEYLHSTDPSRQTDITDNPSTVLHPAIVPRGHGTGRITLGFEF